MCDLISIQSFADDCNESEGGIYKIKIADCQFVNDVIFDADGNVTNIVMSAAGKFQDYTPDDDTAYFKQSSTRQNKKTTVEGESYMKYTGLNNASFQFANQIKSCCCLIAIHYTNRGQKLLQGIVKTDTGWRFTRKKLQADVNIDTQTGEGEDTLEITLKSTSKSFGPPIVMTEPDIDNL